MDDSKPRVATDGRDHYREGPSDAEARVDAAPVDIAVSGKFHAYQLASEFAQLGRLRDLYAAHRRVSAPGSVPRQTFHNRLDLAFWGALSRYLPLGFTVERKAQLFDSWLAKRLKMKEPGVLHSWNGNSLRTFTALKGTGWRLCVERSCPHNRYQFDLVREEARLLEIPHYQDMHALDLAIQELYLADVIVVPSFYSARSYTDAALVLKAVFNRVKS
jgi:hypothetical protein